MELEVSNVRNRFLYILYIAIDGNFKLKGKQRHLKDVELMAGWGAYVPEQDYQTHIANYVDQPEVSAPCCSKDTFKLNTHTDKYMRVPAQRACTSWYSVITGLCHLGYGFSDLFKALHDMQKWSWRSSVRQKVGILYIIFYFVS